MKIVVIRQAGDSGQLYGSVTARDIAEALTEEGFKVDRGQVAIERPIKALGLSDVRIRLHPEVTVAITVNVARSADEAALQEKYGGAIPTGDMDQDEEETVEAAELFENPEEAKALEESAEEEASRGRGRRREGNPGPRRRKPKCRPRWRTDPLTDRISKRFRNQGRGRDRALFRASGPVDSRTD